MPSNRQIDISFLSGKCSPRDRQVDLFNGAVLELLGELMISFVVFCNDQYAGGLLV
jgi:hypothetical protein